MDFDGVVGVDGGAPSQNVGVDEPLLVGKHEHHLLGAARCHLGLNRVWQALLYPLFDCLLV
jgi:hypothetical protein